MIYIAGKNRCWIRVIAYGNQFRAGTNNQTAYEQLDHLAYRRNQADAQADLDALAARLHWNEVTDFTHNFLRGQKCDTD